MFSATTLLPLLLVLALEAEAVPSNRRSWGAQRPNKRENAPRAVSTTTTRASGDFQTYNTGAGGVFAPAVTTNGNYWYQSGTQYNYIYDALVGSCNTQATNCVLSLSVLDKTVCWGSQVWACTSNAQTAANSYSSSANAYSTSVASANYAAATQARSTSGDYQTFTGALGGIAAPAVTAGSNGIYVSSGQNYNSLQAALDGSCYYQMNACQQAANTKGNKLELTVANCNGPQIQACLAAETTIIANAAKSASNSAAAYSSSVAAYSSSAAAYSQSASAAAYSASAYSYSASSSAAAARATSVSSIAKSSASSSSAPSSSSSNAATPTTAPAATVSGNFQTFSGAIGGVAPAVTRATDGTWKQSGNTYNDLASALQQSCYIQAGICASSSVIDKTPCWGTQVNACLAAGTSIANAFTSSAGVYSSSVASANLAAATMARTTANDLQSFTGAIAKIPAPAVTGSPANWWMNGLYFYNLIDALSQSCYVQQGLCEAAAVSANNALEVTVNNCDNVQTPACLANAQTVVSNYGKSSSSASAASSAANTASAAAYSASVSAYSSSVAAQAASASAYSAQQSASAYSAGQAAAQQSAAAYSQSSAAAYSSSASAYSAQQSASAYSAQQAAAQQSAAAYSQSSAAAYSSSASAYSAQQSASAYSAQQAAAQQSAAAYSQSSAAAYSSSASAYSAQQSASAYSAQQAAAQQSAAAYSSSVSASAAAASASAAAAAQATAVPSGWSMASTSCIAEGTSGRALISDSFTDGAMIWAKCTSYCSSKGYPLAGLEYSSECYCGQVLSNGASLNRPSSQCNMQASGNQGQIAGGPNAITLFVSNNLDYSKYTADLSGVVTVLPSGWQSLTSDSGICIIEGTSGRALAGASTASDDMTNAKCIAFCDSKGMQYAGTEYSRECYCGNDLVNGASISRTAPCNMQCSGAPGTVCGGPGTLSIFKNTNLQYTNTQVGQYSKQGCIQEVAGRALTGASTVTNDMTIEKCTAFCQQGGFAFAGLEYSSECYCGNTLSNGASLSSFSTQCNMPCSGNNGQTCGGPNAITLYSTEAGLALVGA